MLWKNLWQERLMEDMPGGGYTLSTAKEETWGLLQDSESLCWAIVDCWRKKTGEWGQETGVGWRLWVYSLWGQLKTDPLRVLKRKRQSRGKMCQGLRCSSLEVLAWHKQDSGIDPQHNKSINQTKCPKNSEKA
jgi:hypothetical protein